MKGSRDTWILTAVLAAFVVGVCWFSARQTLVSDTPSSYSTGKRGTKAFYLLLQELGLRVGRYRGRMNALPAEARLLLIVDPDAIEPADAAALARWVRKGNTLVLAVSRSFAVPPEFQVHQRPEFPSDPVVARPMRGPYADGVRRVRMDPQVSVRTSRAIVARHGRTFAGEQPLGRGRVIVLGDPLILANSMIREEDNVVLLTNVVYENAGESGLILFVEPEVFLAGEKKAAPAIGRAGKLALAQLAFTVLLVLISAGWRFGAVHPLPERTEKRRAWEFVRAMAGLYRRAEAREAALGAVYQSFRRQLHTRFGVSADAAPAAAAQAVLRARPVDLAQLTALLSRCDQIAAGRKTSDDEMIALTRSIEEFRSELGVGV